MSWYVQISLEDFPRCGDVPLHPLVADVPHEPVPSAGSLRALQKRPCRCRNQQSRRAWQLGAHGHSGETFCPLTVLYISETTSELQIRLSNYTVKALNFLLGKPCEVTCMHKIPRFLKKFIGSFLRRRASLIKFGNFVYGLICGHFIYLVLGPGAVGFPFRPWRNFIYRVAHLQ